MCGIVGYVGRNEAAPILLEGLSRLEYRGYDSAGICVAADGVLHVENMKAALQKLHELGVAKWAVIHCPEIGCGMDENGNYYEFESLKLPKGYIKGTVGAGDAFCAGVLYAAETDMPLPEALKLGACSAAASLSEVSASDGVKTKDEVLKLYELYGKK